MGHPPIENGTPINLIVIAKFIENGTPINLIVIAKFMGVLNYCPRHG